MVSDSARSQPRQSLNILAAVVVVSFVTVVLFWARAILIPIALAVLFTFVLAPLVAILQRRGLGRVPSVFIVVGTSFVFMAGVGVVIVEQIVQLTKTLPDHADRIKAKTVAVKRWVSSDETSRLNQLINDLSETLEPATAPVPASANSSAIVVSPTSSWVTRAQTYLSPAAEALGQAAFTSILVVFMLLRREDLRNRAIRLFGQGQVTTTTKAVDETSRRISRYLLAQFLLNASFGLVITLVMFLMGVPYAPLWGFIGSLMRYVPYIGTWIGVIPPALFTFAVSDGWELTVGVLVLFLGLEAIINNFFEPMLYGPRLGLSEVAQLVATAFWAFLWGPVGMILAWPLTTCLLMLGKYVSQLRFLNVLLGDEPVLSPRLAFYQRLAARDPNEAAAIVEKELATRSADEVMNDLLIPALSQARLDVSSSVLSHADMTFVTRAVEEITEDVADSTRMDSDPVPMDHRIPILLIPAKDAADHAGCSVFGKMLEPMWWDVHPVANGTLSSELISQVDKTSPACVVIVSLAPGGLTHSRFLCKRIRARFPKLKIVVGRWADTDEELARAIDELKAAGATDVSATAHTTLALLDGWRSVFDAGNVIPAAKGGEPKLSKLLGTVPA